MTAVTASDKLHIVSHLREISGNGFCADIKLVSNCLSGNLWRSFYTLKNFLLHIRKVLGDILGDIIP